MAVQNKTAIGLHRPAGENFVTVTVLQIVDGEVFKNVVETQIEWVIDHNAHSPVSIVTANIGQAIGEYAAVQRGHGDEKVIFQIAGTGYRVHVFIIGAR